MLAPDGDEKGHREATDHDGHQLGLHSERFSLLLLTNGLQKHSSVARPESIGAFGQYARSGKVRDFGLLTISSVTEQLIEYGGERRIEQLFFFSGFLPRSASL